MTCVLAQSITIYCIDIDLGTAISKVTIMIRDCNAGPNPIRAVVNPESPEHAPKTIESQYLSK